MTKRPRFPASAINIDPTLTGRQFQRKHPKFLADIYMVGEFVGRKNDLKRLKELLEGPHHHITIHGFGGIGKTALALQAAKEFDSGKVLALSLAGTPKLSDVIRKLA